MPAIGRSESVRRSARLPAVLLLVAVVSLAAAAPAHAPAQPQGSFARLVARLSEPGGYFNSDNLVSNETSYLHAMGALRRLGVHGGAYLGVGPEQGFSYIAEIEPEIAIIIDIRRDNMLLHLLMKAMFEEARNRVEYLALFFGRRAPENWRAWTNRPLVENLFYIDSTPLDTVLYNRIHDRLMRRVTGYGIPITAEDRGTLRRFHDQFVFFGLNLTFTSGSGFSRRNYPSMRRLYMEEDLEGNQVSYLATDARWRRIRTMQRANRIVPVVGDLAGTTAMPAIARYLRETGRAVSAFYTSNVEMYLFRGGTFPAFARNVRALPSDARSVIIRSWFDRGGFGGLPSSVPGHFSTQVVQRFDRFAALADTASYWSLVNAGEELRTAEPTGSPR